MLQKASEGCEWDPFSHRVISISRPLSSLCYGMGSKTPRIISNINSKKGEVAASVGRFPNLECPEPVSASERDDAFQKGKAHWQGCTLTQDEFPDVFSEISTPSTAPKPRLATGTIQ